MLPFARILAILLVTLGFQIHGFVGALSSANASACASITVAESDSERGQMVPDKPTPSCKVIGASSDAISHGSRSSMQSIRPTIGDGGFAAVWPRGPEKPPKAG